MDVGLGKFWRLFCVLALVPILTFCGSSNHEDPSTPAGRQALIDDANNYLNNGQCQLAYNAISQIYGTSNQTEEVELIMSSTYACFAGFNLLTMASNLIGASNFYNAIVKSVPSQAGDNHISRMYQAADVLTYSTSVLSASQRSTSINNYLVFIEAGIVAAILSSYGKADSNGNKTQAISYHTPPAGADMSTVDACALEAALSIMNDSYKFSNLSDSSTASFITSMNSACVTAGFSSCSALNNNRTLCTGQPADANSVGAVGIVGAINSGW